MPFRFEPSHAKKAASTQTAIDWLSADQHSASVLTTARTMLSIEEAMHQVLPEPLAQACRVARIDRQRMTLAVPSAAYASRLRQLAPRIIQLLSQNGWNINEIGVRVQAGLLQLGTKRPHSKEAQPLDDDALRAFETLRDNLRPGPLAHAISKMLDRHRRT